MGKTSLGEDESNEESFEFVKMFREINFEHKGCLGLDFNRLESFLCDSNNVVDVRVIKKPIFLLSDVIIHDRFNYSTNDLGSKMVYSVA